MGKDDDNRDDNRMTGEEKEKQQDFSFLFFSSLLFSFLFLRSSLLLFFCSTVRLFDLATTGKTLRCGLWDIYGKRRLFPILLRPFLRAVSCI